ncbi:hypothetical protein ACHAPU_007225 [Fusarium lateritium]
MSPSRPVSPLSPAHSLSTAHKIAQTTLLDHEKQRAEIISQVKESGGSRENESTAIRAVTKRLTQLAKDEVEASLIHPSNVSQGSVRRKRKRPLITGAPSEAGASSVRRRKTKAATVDGELFDDLKSLFETNQSTTHNYILRVPGADDLETAVKSCVELFHKSRGVEFVLKVVRWLKKDALNAVTWNALEDKQLKEALADSI